jgi:DNA-binding CsgD family transcriptional regulator
VRTRLSSRRFVGRVGELAELELAVREAASGRPGLVLLGGDSGVGKTRLVAELSQRLAAAPEPPRVLVGGAVAPEEGELPHAALLGALRPLVRERDEVFAALDPATGAQLAGLLPGLDGLAGLAGFDGLGAAARPAPATLAAGSGDQLRLFEAVLALLDRLGARTPVLLVLEDLHWADRSTRTFLGFLARSLRSERVAVLATYRRDELHRRHPLRPLLGELERLDRVRVLELEPFDRQELSEALSDILGAAPEPALLERLFARSEGNALYTEELLAAGLDGRGAPPRTLSDAFLGRIERLSADAQRVARALSLGRALDEPALRAVTGLGDARLSDALREALGEQVLVVAAGDAFGFRHALLREALYDDLLPGERGTLHTALADHLQAGDPRDADGDAEQRLQRLLAIAFHRLAAGDQTAALQASVAAADVARAENAMGEAADLYERALELWPRVPDAVAVAGIDHVSLLGRAAVALSLIDQRVRADALLREALGELDPATDPARYALLLGQHGRTLWSLNRGQDAVAAAERALALLPDGDPGGDRAWIRAWLARMQCLRGHFREAETEVEAALVEARAIGDELAETELLNTRGMVLVSLGRTEGGLQSLRDAIALADRRRDLDSRATAYANLADTLLIAGRVGEAVQVAETGLAVTPRDLRRSRDWLTLILGEMCFHAGHWARAEACLAPAPERMTGILLIFRRIREAELAAGIGDDERAMDCLTSIGDLVAASIEPQWIGVYGALIAELHARRGELDAARAAVAAALDRLEVCTDDVGRISIVSLVGVAVEADRAQRARDLGETAARRDAVARARLHHSRVQAAAQDGGPREHARFVHATAELARARGRAGAAGWARAAAAWEEIAHPYPAAIAHWREAECQVEHGERERATQAARAALAAAHELGSEWLEREVRGLAERARLAIADAAPAPEAAPAAALADPFGLTERERQVLRLVAEGATNRQIGNALYMAEKTASVHVSRILAKLDVRSRTEAAAVAHRLHLA